MGIVLIRVGIVLLIRVSGDSFMNPRGRIVLTIRVGIVLLIRVSGDSFMNPRGRIVLIRVGIVLEERVNVEIGREMKYE